MESGTDALANDGDADDTPCITVATLYVATASPLVALYYRRKLYRAIFQVLDGKNIFADIEPANLQTSDPVGRRETRGIENGKVIFVITVTTRRRDPIGEAATAMHAFAMRGAVNKVLGKHITRRSVTTTGRVFKGTTFTMRQLEVIAA